MWGRRVHCDLSHFEVVEKRGCRVIGKYLNLVHH